MKRLWHHRDDAALQAAVDHHPAGSKLADKDERTICPVVDLFTREEIR